MAPEGGGTTVERALALLATLAQEAVATVRAGASREGWWKAGEAGNWVTATDLAIERRARRAVAAAFPDHGWAGEETGAATGSGGWLWSVDPVDGTTNYVHGLPWAAFSAGLLREGEPVAGVVADLFRGEIWLGAVGKGVWTVPAGEGVVPARRALAGAVVLTELKGNRPWPGMTDWMERASRQGAIVRVMGSTALALAACALGRAAAAVLHSPSLWDVAGGLALCRASGRVTVADWQGRPAAVPAAGIAASLLPEADWERLLASLPKWRPAADGTPPPA